MVFQSYTIFTRVFSPSASSNGAPLPIKDVALGGFGAGALQSLLMSPVELVKIRRQLQNSTGQSTETDKSPIRIAKNIWKNEGLRGVYRGLGSTMLRDAPAYAFYFSTYEYMREKLHPGCRESGQDSLNTMYIAGGLAGIASWVFNYPVDVIKTRLQVQTPSSMKYKGIMDCALKIIKEEGHVVLWRGLGPTIVRAFVANSVVFPAYEFSLRLLYKN